MLTGKRQELCHRKKLNYVSWNWKFVQGRGRRAQKTVVINFSSFHVFQSWPSERDDTDKARIHNQTEKKLSLKNKIKIFKVKMRIILIRKMLKAYSLFFLCWLKFQCWQMVRERCNKTINFKNRTCGEKIEKQKKKIQK